MWVCFGCKTESYSPVFQLFLHRWKRGPEKLSKFDRITFQPYWRNGNHKNCNPKSVGVFWALNRVIWVPVSTFYAPVVLGPETFVKICPRLFLPVWIKNGKKCIPNSLGILQLSKLSHPGPILNFACSDGPRARKGCQNSTETFFSHTDRKTIRTAQPNDVCMFSLQNWVIRARFSTFRAPVVSRLEKSSKLDRIIFQPYWRETIETAPQIVWVCLECQM